MERLRAGESVVVAEGYLFEFEARGQLKIGSYVPEVVLERPDLVKEMHREFYNAGSDVVLAFTVSLKIILHYFYLKFVQVCPVVHICCVRLI